LSYSVGFGLPDHTADLLAKIPQQAWSPALDAEGQVRDGAWVADFERHEALLNRVEVRDLHRRVVAAAR
jgi:hypothetical protein